MKKILYSIVAVLNFSTVDVTCGAAMVPQGAGGASAARGQTAQLQITDAQFARLRQISFEVPEDSQDGKLARRYMLMFARMPLVIRNPENFDDLLNRYPDLGKRPRVSLDAWRRLRRMLPEFKRGTDPRSEDVKRVVQAVEDHLFKNAEISDQTLTRVVDLVEEDRDNDEYGNWDWEPTDSIDEALAALGNQADDVENVDMSDRLLGDEGVKTITTLLEGSRKIRTMDLSNCGITDVGAAALLEFIESHPAVTSVKLGKNHISKSLLGQIIAAYRKNRK